MIKNWFACEPVDLISNGESMEDSRREKEEFYLKCLGNRRIKKKGKGWKEIFV
ncbi:predicted protein [Sclerotinia sclerotiorum 1980 UF-70]|uniref:Uncharacterized protein n=1 Tax=Sclerotinia sclerotiorum (strain ATCC 18683 / 1980 / Ss-1) TaxID=665079 RepID=A7EZT7_SCLS1|nr:predicted protein [Sclerotinia sclerotiorum 1980 UF-70]EDN94979.1 predicted protein [Sclerotinia sclerotiorum 1980 UF-70]